MLACNQCAYRQGGLNDVITPGLADVITGDGLGDVGISVGVNQGGVTASGSASLLWLGIAGLVGWLYWKR